MIQERYPFSVWLDALFFSLNSFETRQGSVWVCVRGERGKKGKKKEFAGCRMHACMNRTAVLVVERALFLLSSSFFLSFFLLKYWPNSDRDSSFAFWWLADTCQLHLNNQPSFKKSWIFFQIPARDPGNYIMLGKFSRSEMAWMSLVVETRIYTWYSHEKKFALTFMIPHTQLLVFLWVVETLDREPEEWKNNIFLFERATDTVNQKGEHRDRGTGDRTQPRSFPSSLKAAGTNTQRCGEHHNLRSKFQKLKWPRFLKFQRPLASPGQGQHPLFGPGQRAEISTEWNFLLFSFVIGRNFVTDECFSVLFHRSL